MQSATTLLELLQVGVAPLLESLRPTLVVRHYALRHRLHRDLVRLRQHEHKLLDNYPHVNVSCVEYTTHPGIIQPNIFSLPRSRSPRCSMPGRKMEVRAN